MNIPRAQLYQRLGFDSADPDSRLCFAPAVWLALAFFALPFCLLAPIDADRHLPLLFLPAVLLGWPALRPVTPGLARLAACIFATLLAATALADHAARSLVCVAALAWLFAAGLLAQNLSRCLPAVRLVLAGVALGAVAGSGLVIAGAGLGAMDFPTYWGVRVFSMHQFAGTVAALGLLTLRPGGKGPLFASLVLCTLTATSLAASGSRAPAAGLVLMLACWFWRGSGRERRMLLLGLPAITSVALAASWLVGTPYSGMGWWSAVARTTGATSLESVSSARSYFWSVVWDQIWLSPWLGHGADAYRYIQPRLHGAQPHNFLLQWLYEYGVFGTTALLLLLACALLPLLRRPAGADRLQPWASSAVAGALGYGLFDGVFYHQVAYMPVAVFTGLALGSGWTRLTEHPASQSLRLLRPCLLAAFLVLLLHGWLGLMLLRAPDVAPDSPPARLLRAFPSTTHGLSNWIGRWKESRPEVALEWIQWAQTRSDQQPEFHLAAVQIYLGRRDFISAERELRACLPKVRDIEVADVERLLSGVSAKAREQASAPAPQGAK